MATLGRAPSAALYHEAEAPISPSPGRAREVLPHKLASERASEGKANPSRMANVTLIHVEAAGEGPSLMDEPVLATCRSRREQYSLASGGRMAPQHCAES